MLIITCLASLLLCVFAEDIPISDLCPYECRCTGERVYCHHFGWTAMPGILRLSSNYTGLEIYANRIGSIPSGRFPANLVYIDFRANRIENISSDAFDAISDTLETIYFSSARFTELPDAFRNLTTLKLLSIESTPVSVFDNDTMANIGATLDTLILTDVGLSSWPDWLQKTCVNLEILTLSDFPIVNVPDDAFQLMKTQLRILTLENVGLTHVPTALADLAVLEVLNLAENKIQSLPGVPRQANLLSINVAGNMISDADMLSNDLSPYADTLADIDLSRNNLTQISDFSNFSMLFTVDFTQNLISDHNSGNFSDFLACLSLSWNELPYVPTIVASLSGLTWLDLSNNLIREFNFSTVSPALLFLDLGYNSVTELKENTAPYNLSLLSVKLYSNPISYISQSAFTGLPSLLSLDLGHTKLTRFPMALSALPALDELYMNALPDFLCTCEEAGIVDWFAERFSMQLYGTCGDFSIDDFFIMFGPQCPKLDD